MDNDNKINFEQDSSANEAMLFLADELESLHQSKQVDVYDLETEYAKTAKNKLWSVWLTLIFTILACVILTFCILTGVTRKYKKIDVNMSSFNDVNMQKLAEQHTEIKEKFDETFQKQVELKANLETILYNAKVRQERRLERLNNNPELSESKKTERRKQIQDDYEAAVKAAHNEFDTRISTTEAELKQLENQLKSFDKEKVATAQKWENSMGGEQEVQKLMLDRFRKRYEEQIALYKELLNNIPVNNNVAGFVMNTSSEYGIGIFVRNEYKKDVRQGTTLDIYDGKTKIASGVVTVVRWQQYISLDKVSDTDKISVGNTVVISDNN